MRVAVFGGAFDPPHNGHLEVVNKVLALNLADEVWLMPNFSANWKGTGSSPDDRFEMCQIFARLISPKVKVSDLEIKREGVSFTRDTVEYLQAHYDDDFFWIIGSDLIKDIPTWEKGEGLTEKIVFLSFPRTQVSSTEIREKIKKGEAITSLVPIEIERYLKEHNLYH